MKVLQINSVCGIRSTGRICTDLADVLRSLGHECRIAYGRECVPQKYQDISFRIGNEMDVRMHALNARLFDSAGFHSKTATKELLSYIDNYAPDIIHLHNIHGYYLNIELLFDYIKKRDIPVVWTLHDCWAFTGHCSHYSAIGCDRWRAGCEKCPQKREYPQSILFDNSKRNYQRKKECFTGVHNMTLVTPSEWLAEQVKGSFLGEYPVKVIQNGIDTEVFKPTIGNFRQQYGLENKIIVLGVATSWGEKKGLDRFFELSQVLDSRFKVVLVGLDSEQLAHIPDTVIGIEKTNSVTELAEIYTAADVCLSLSFEETMGLTVVEANVCGTPAIVLNKTALPELITKGRNGVVVHGCNIAEISELLHRIDFKKDFSSDACVDEAMKFEKWKKYNEYIETYKEMMI